MEVTILSFSELDLNSECIATLEQAGYKEPTELQRQLIPLINAKKNVLVKSQSASGKTGAFLIPAINYVLENPLEDYHGARVLILTSRKDRVNQIKYTVKKLANNQNFRFGFIVSGRPYQPQMRLLRRPLDIMVATPGRLSDLSDNGKADFSQVEMLIVDDLASIYHKEFHGLIDKILGQRTRDYPIVLFVRDDDGVVDYANSLIPDAVELEVEEDKHPLSRIPQRIQLCDDYTHKIAIMDYLLDEYQGEPALIYTSSDKAASYLADNLANHGHSVDVAIDLSEQERATSTALIISDESPVQLDSYDFPYVIHFELPKSVGNYIRRMDAKGWEAKESPVVALLGIQERESLKQIEELLGVRIEQQTTPGLESLNPFATFTPDFSSSKSRHGKSNQQKKPRRNAGQFGKRRNDKQRKESSSNENKKRAKKGRFGRLSGGIHRKREEASLAKSKTNKPAFAQTKSNQNRSPNGFKNKPMIRSKQRKIFKSPSDSNLLSPNRGSVFPTIKDPQDIVKEKDNTANVVVKYKDKKRFLRGG